MQFLQTPLYIAESVTCTCTLCIVVNQRVCHFFLFTPVCSFTFACLYEQLFNKMYMYICIIDFCSYAVIEKSIKFTFIFCVHSKMFFFNRLHWSLYLNNLILSLLKQNYHQEISFYNFFIS